MRKSITNSSGEELGGGEIGGTHSLKLVEDSVADSVGDEILADLGDDVIDDGDVDGGYVATRHSGGGGDG